MLNTNPTRAQEEHATERGAQRETLTNLGEARRQDRDGETPDREERETVAPVTLLSRRAVTDRR